MKTKFFILLSVLFFITADSFASLSIGINGGGTYFIPNQDPSDVGTTTKAAFKLPIAGVHILTKIKSQEIRLYLEYQNYRISSSASLAGHSYSQNQDVRVAALTGFLNFKLGSLYLGPGFGASYKLSGAKGFFLVTGGALGFQFSKPLFLELRATIDLTTQFSSNLPSPVLLAAQLGFTIF